MADDPQLLQVVVNRVGNAFTYHPPKVPPEVRIPAERTTHGGTFSVADNGVEPEYFGRIFEMFRRLRTHDQFEGTGRGRTDAGRGVRPSVPSPAPCPRSARPR